MTPAQLRVRAKKNMESAGTLLAAGDTDNSCKLAGEAVELALKARYCTRYGIANFPETLYAIKAAGLQHLATHDLQTLLTLAKGIEIPKYANIDWDRVCEWDVVERYDPVGAITNEAAASRLHESGSVIALLSLHELLEQLSHIRVKLDFPIQFFALDIRQEEISLVVGGGVMWQTTEDACLARLKNAVAEGADADLASTIVNYKLVNPLNSMFKAYMHAVLIHGGFKFVTNHFVQGAMIKQAYFIPQAGFIVGDFNKPSQMHNMMVIG